MAIAAIEYIVITPEVCHGAPHIAGTRIRVQDVAMFQHNGWSAEQIAAHFEELRLSQIYAALSYYYDHQGEIDAEIQQAEKAAQTSGGTYLQELKKRLEAGNDTEE